MINETSQIGCIVSINVGTLIALILHFFVVPLEIKVIGRLPFHGEAIINDVVSAHVLIQSRVVHPAIAFDLSTEELDAELIIDERDVDDAFDVLTPVLVNSNAKVAAPLHGHSATGDVDQAPGRVFAKQCALWPTQYLDTFNIEVLH